MKIFKGLAISFVVVLASVFLVACNNNSGSNSALDGIPSGTVYKITVVEGASINTYQSFDYIKLAPQADWELITPQEYNEIGLKETISVHDANLQVLQYSLNSDGTQPVASVNTSDVMGIYCIPEGQAPEFYYSAPIIERKQCYQKIEIKDDGTLSVTTFQVAYNPYKVVEKTFVVSNIGETMKRYNKDGKLNMLTTGLVQIEFFV